MILFRKNRARLAKKARNSVQSDIRQARLKTKYGLQENENVVVVEKSNMVKFLIRTFCTLVRVAAELLVLVLATIGIAALIYPEPRQALISILVSLFEQITGYF